MKTLTKEKADLKILTQEIIDNCICIPHFNSRDCPIHGAEWKKGEEYPPQKKISDGSANEISRELSTDC